jgi:hypothetical protein
MIGMKNLKLISVVISISLIVFACGLSQRDNAAGKLNEAKALIAEGDTLKAIEILKSIPVQLPKAKIQVGVSKNMTDDLYRQMIDNRKAQVASTEKLITALELNFSKEKTQYDMFVQYTPLYLSKSKSWNRSFLQVNLDERGELFLTSNYMGKDWLRHTSIKIYDEELQSKSPEVPLNDPNNRESDFLDYKWEKVSYTNGKSDSVIKFIVDNINRDLKCVYIGENYYYIILEEINKEAIKDAYNLSNAIRRRNDLKNKIKELETKRN